MVVIMLIGSIEVKSKSTGFTYIGVLTIVAISGIALAGVGVVWHLDAQREKEKELLFVGNEYRKAFGSYFESSPDNVKHFPTKLEDLVRDNRFPSVKRHIRRLYADPMAHDKPWNLIVQQGEIIGIRSTSVQQQIKKTGFQTDDEVFSAAGNYSEWAFIYRPK